MATLAKERGYLLARNPMEMVSTFLQLHYIAAHTVVDLHPSTAEPRYILLVTLQACVQTFVCIQ